MAVAFVIVEWSVGVICSDVRDDRITDRRARQVESHEFMGMRMIGQNFH